jgi:hypothetical protein
MIKTNVYLNSLILYLFKHDSEPFKVNVKILIRAAAHPAHTLEPPLRVGINTSQHM